jgi:hypothetical protein
VSWRQHYLAQSRQYLYLADVNIALSAFFSFTFQLAVITQGIATRLATRQASSEQAHLYAAKYPMIGELARRVLEDEGHVRLPHKVQPKL